VPEQFQKAQRWPLFLAISGVHILAVTAFLAQQGSIDLSQVREQSRLTLIKIANVMQIQEKEAPQPAVETAEQQVQPSPQVPTVIEWTRVRNWREKASGVETMSGGDGRGFDATRLLAGLGAAGPAGATEGVADPYAGASPIWSGGGKKSTLLLIGAPNPAVLEQIRRQVALSFPGVRGYARLTVLVDKDGVVVRVAKVASDLPIAAQQMFEANLVGRVVSASHPSEHMLELPEIQLI
jgi:hypothetical protein